MQEGKHVAEITHLLSRAVGWPAGLRWIVRRTKPSRRQIKNLTAFRAGYRLAVLDHRGEHPRRRDRRRARQPPPAVHRRAAPRARLGAHCEHRRRLLGLYDCDDLKDAEPDTLRYRLLSLPARLVRHSRARVLKISRTWPWNGAFLACWQRVCALPAPA